MESHHILTWKQSWKNKVSIVSKTESEPRSEATAFPLALTLRADWVAVHFSVPQSRPQSCPLFPPPCPLYLSSSDSSLPFYSYSTNAAPAFVFYFDLFSNERLWHSERNLAVCLFQRFTKYDHIWLSSTKLFIWGKEYRKEMSAPEPPFISLFTYSWLQKKYMLTIQKNKI